MKTASTKKRAKPINARLLAMKHWRELGYKVEIVERDIRGADDPTRKPGKFAFGFKRDFFNFADLIAYRPTQTALVFIQAGSNSGGNHSSHFWKILENKHAFDLALAGHGIWLATFWKDKKTGRYESKFKQFKPDDFVQSGVVCEYPADVKRRERAMKKTGTQELFT